VDDATRIAISQALEENPEALFDAFEEGIAASIEDVTKEDVAVYDVVVSVTRRLLSNSAWRRLAASIWVGYVIHVDAQHALDSGIDEQFLSDSLESSAIDTFTDALTANADVLGLAVNFTIISLSAPAPEGTIVEEESVPTVTSSTTVSSSTMTTTTSAPMPTESGDLAAIIGPVGAAIAVLACCIACCVAYRRRKQARVAQHNFSIAPSTSQGARFQHVLWDLDVQAIHLEEKSSEQAGGSEQVGSGHGYPDDVLDCLSPQQAVPILNDLTAVEYYSKTNNRWMQGWLRVTLEPGTLTREPEVTYCVEVQTGSTKYQLRENVNMDSFRASFVDGDAVEIFSTSTATWLPAVVAGTQNAPTRNGYKLRVEAQEDAGQQANVRMAESVLPSKVRRRFDDGSLVQCYRGPGDGWCYGSVDRRAEVSGTIDTSSLLRIMSPRDTSPHASPRGPRESPRGSRMSPRDSPRSLRDSSLASPRAQGVEARPTMTHPRTDSYGDGECTLWSMVPFREVDTISAIMVPSFLLLPMT